MKSTEYLRTSVKINDPMEVNEKQEEKARFNIRLSKEKNPIFEKALLLGGYRRLSDFIILTAQEKAKKII